LGPSALGPPVPGPKKTWVQQNWKWLLPSGCLGLVVLSAAFIGGIFFLVENSFRNSDVCTQSLARARVNPEVIEGIGQPLQAGWLVTGNIQVIGSSGNADLSIPVSGPKGKATIYAVARKAAGVWQFETLQVAIRGQAKRIDLLQQERQLPPTQPDST
jgi:Cytochrome oxidase complex assembly protein 1